MAFLVSLSGLPGVGKTATARALSKLMGAVHVRVDTVEAALKTSTLQILDPEDSGYAVAYAIARDNLGLGLDVVADTVNPLAVTREAWAEVARATQSDIANVELICSSASEYQRRVETRRSDIDGLVVPTWEHVKTRDYQTWTEPRLVIDSASSLPSDCAEQIVRFLSSSSRNAR